MTAPEPILVAGMRAFPTGEVRRVRDEVRHVPDAPIGMTGTPTVTFLAEYDEAIAAAYQRGYTDGYAVAAEEAALEERVQADRDDYHSSREADGD